MHSVKRSLILAAAAATTLIFSALPAQAVPGGGFHTPPAPYSDSGEFDPECAGLDLTVEYHNHGVYSDRNVPGSDGQAFVFKDSFTFTEVWTDNATGEVILRTRGAYVVEEVDAKRVPNAAVPPAVIPEEGLVGPVYLFTRTESGSDTVRDGDGNILYLTAGVVTFKNLFDTLGDSQPGGVGLVDEIVNVVGPHPLLNTDICEVAEDQVSTS